MYFDLAGIKHEFGEHLRKYLGYSDIEIEIAVDDFPDPYEACYLCETHVDDCTIDGEKYEKCATLADFGILDVDAPNFCFFTYYRKADIRRHTVAQYKKAKKLYSLSDIDYDEFVSFWK